MTNSEHLTEFGGFAVTAWAPKPEASAKERYGGPFVHALGDPATTIHRISTDYDSEPSWTDLFRAFLAQSGVEHTQGLVVGAWQGDDSETTPGEVIEALVAAREKLPRLRVLFFGDIVMEENEVSWIQQGDLSPLLSAYPHLTHLGIRGGEGLSLGTVRLPELRELIVQAGGLSAEVVREVLSAELPNLEHLELYLGTDNYGATSAPDDLTPLLSAERFPKLNYLGVKNSDYQDAIAQMFAHAPVLERLEVLDLSMGVLTDEGGAALLGSQSVRRLKKLDLSHHFLSEGLLVQLRALGDFVDLGDAQDPDDEWRFVALGE
ncbi:STM4015 family protein [Deinococcus sp.]|uniref:STM4015 family protein n=1 Tax=Deinococcus sp. TaxID=47478 RepID=UPI0025F34AAC|nr:STM4015 family protein [Deinococcus sp.]